MRFPRLFLFLWLGMFSVCHAQSNPSTTVPPAAIPSGVVAQQDCAVLAGGNVGSQFSDPKITRFWAMCNEEITKALHDNLVADKYRALKLIVGEGENVSRVVPYAIARNKCGRIIQLTHNINEDRDGKFIAYRLDVFRIEPSKTQAPAGSGRKVVTVEEYSREYKYPRTEAAMSSFRFKAFARTAYEDLKPTGVLEPLR